MENLGCIFGTFSCFSSCEYLPLSKALKGFLECESFHFCEVAFNGPIHLVTSCGSVVESFCGFFGAFANFCFQQFRVKSDACIFAILSAFRKGFFRTPTDM